MNVKTRVCCDCKKTATACRALSEAAEVDEVKLQFLSEKSGGFEESTDV